MKVNNIPYGRENLLLSGGFEPEIAAYVAHMDSKIIHLMFVLQSVRRE